MKRIFIFLIILTSLLWSPFQALAEISVSLKIDRSEATLADSIRLVISVSGTRNIDSPPILHGMELFNVTKGGTSSRVEIVNGQMNAGIDYTYFIQPKHTGSFKIGPAQISVKGRTYKSTIERLVVVQPDSARGKGGEPLFMIAQLSKDRMYIEEQAIYTIKLYLRVRAGNVSLPSIPENPGLSIKQHGQPREYQSVYNGQNYHVVEVRYLLVPSKKGTYSVGPAKMSMTVISSGRGSNSPFSNDPFFRDFFQFRSGRPITVTSEAVELEVTPLPVENRPVDFTGLIGRYNMISKLEPPSVRAGESATLTVHIRGRGNVNRIPDLKLPDISHSKIYADQPVLKMEQDSNGVGGSKTMKWAIVPDKEGRFQIPTLSVSFFDTETNEYRSLKTFPHTLIVERGEREGEEIRKKDAQTPSAEAQSKLEVKEIGRDIMPIHTSLKNLAQRPSTVTGGLFFWIVLFIPFILYFGILCLMKYSRKSDNAIAAAKARKAARQFVKRCGKGQSNSGDLILSVRDYLNDRFRLSLGSLTPAEAEDILKAGGVSDDTAKKLSSILQNLEDSVYTGKGRETCDMGEDLFRLIMSIRKEIG